MALIKNKDTGNFYPISIPEVDWHCDYLWSTHRGCPFDCAYCSSKRLNVRFGGDPCEIRRLKGEWKTDCKYANLVDIENLKRKTLPYGAIFVNPYCDIMTLSVYDIKQILDLSRNSLNDYGKENRYISTEKDCFRIFQTKDPAKYFDYLDLIPEGSWLGTTIETNKVTLDYKDISKAPAPFLRFDYMRVLHEEHKEFKYFVTIEPILRFTETFMYYIEDINPDLVFIGANTSNVKLPEPTTDELIELIEQLRKITTVYLKSNLKRLLPKGYNDTK